MQQIKPGGIAGEDETMNAILFFAVAIYGVYSFWQNAAERIKEKP